MAGAQAVPRRRTGGAGCICLSSTLRPDPRALGEMWPPSLCWHTWPRCGVELCQHVALPAAGQWDGTVALHGWGCGFLWWLWWLWPPLHVTTPCWGQGSCLLLEG